MIALEIDIVAENINSIIAELVEFIRVLGERLIRLEISISADC